MVITTVGPYLAYGEPLVAACADAGTDYVDLTGEPEFVDRMYLRHHQAAVRSGARLVHACGFDSVPHDLGALWTVEQLPSDTPITLRGVVRSGGTASGGTIHSALEQFARARQMKEAYGARRRAEGKPADGRRSRPVSGKPHKDSVLGYWLLPLADHRPDRRRPQRRRARGVRPRLPLLPLRRHQDDPVRRGRRGRRRRAGPAAQVGPLADSCSGKVAQGQGPDEAVARSLVHRRLRR